MSEANPFQPPRAEVADLAPAEFSEPRVWAWRGRIGRLRYLAYLMAGYIGVVVLSFVGGFLGALGDSEWLATAALILGGSSYLLLMALSSIQRSHDMDWSGWSALGAFVPLVNLIWLFKAGTPGANRFGHPPPPNTLGVKLLAWIPLAIFVVGILAAIVLPAYLGYQQRANAAQGAGTR